MPQLDQTEQTSLHIRLALMEQIVGRGRHDRAYYRARQKWAVSVEDSGDVPIIVIDGPRYLDDNELAAALSGYGYVRGDYQHVQHPDAERTIAHLFNA